MQVNARKLLLHLTGYLKRIAHGHSLKISMQARPVAQPSPIQDKIKVETDDLFGSWSDRADQDVETHVQEIRLGRKL